jgi:parallel beta-helix repeat protein
MHRRAIKLAAGPLVAWTGAVVLLWLLGLGLPAHAGPAPSSLGVTADELRVCPSGCDYSSIQDAVDEAEPGDVIKVAQGTFTDLHTIPSLHRYEFTATQVVAITKSITIRGGYTSDDWNDRDTRAHPTILDAQGRGRVMVIIGSGISPLIEGLHLTGGDATGLGGSVYDNDAGGGCYVLGGTAVISDNVIEGNTAYRGAGVWLQDSTVTFQANEVRNNTAGWAAAGMALYQSPATLRGNQVVYNSAIFAAGIVLHLSDASLRGNAILSNTADLSEGGGVTVLSSKATLDGNLILGNKVDEAGGGVYLQASDATLTNNVIGSNFADRLGSGLYVDGGSPHLIHNTIAGNSGLGGGLYAATTDWGLASDVVMTNTIVYGHTEGIIAADGSTVTLCATLWHANATNWIGPGTINRINDHTGDPAFAADGYHLTPGSAAIDKGVPSDVTTDIDGDSRPACDGPDLGADELPIWRVYLPLVMRNSR